MLINKAYFRPLLRNPYIYCIIPYDLYNYLSFKHLLKALEHYKHRST